MKRFRKVLIVLLAILVPVSIGFGFNFFSWNKSQELSKEAMTVDGALTITDVANVKNLVPGDKICDGVTMDIKSSAVSLLRVKVDVYCADSTTPETDIAPIDNPGTNWLKGSDGYYYYYAKGVKNDDIVKLAEDGIYFNGLNDNVDINKYQGKKIKVVANAELVQAKHGVFAEKWGLSENKDGDIYTKLKKISNDQGQ